MNLKSILIFIYFFGHYIEIIPDNSELSKTIYMYCDIVLSFSIAMLLFIKTDKRSYTERSLYFCFAITDIYNIVFYLCGVFGGFSGLFLILEYAIFGITMFYYRFRYIKTKKSREFNPNKSYIVFYQPKHFISYIVSAYSSYQFGGCGIVVHGKVYRLSHGNLLEDDYNPRNNHILAEINVDKESSIKWLSNWKMKYSLFSNCVVLCKKFLISQGYDVGGITPIGLYKRLADNE